MGLRNKIYHTEDDEDGRMMMQREVLGSPCDIPAIHHLFRIQMQAGDNFCAIEVPFLVGWTQ